MHLRYDFHTHSTASDGTLSPKALVRQGAAAGIERLALTDHDTLGGVAEAQATALEQGIELIPGVEISVTWQGHTVHILGLKVTPNAPILREGLRGLRGYRAWRAQEMGRRLERAGYRGAYQGALALADGGLVGRLHFARYLVQQGHARDVRQVFKRFLVKGKPGYVESQWASLEEALTWIKAAGGVAVVAHPARYKMTTTKLRGLLGAFRELGGLGLEVVSGSHGKDDMYRMGRLASELGLLASAGSDFHGPGHSWLELGKLPLLPVGCRPIWHQI